MNKPASELIALADNELLVYCRDDASRWASAFVAIKEAQGWGSNDIDNDLMLCWFANAIEGATAYRAAATPPAQPAPNPFSVSELWEWLCHNPRRPSRPRTVAGRKVEMSDKCPACSADLDGGPIPENIREHYSSPYRWSRKIGVYDRDADRTIAWKCPDCGHEWGAQP